MGVSESREGDGIYTRSIYTKSLPRTETVLWSGRRGGYPLKTPCAWVKEHDGLTLMVHSACLLWVCDLSEPAWLSSIVPLNPSASRQVSGRLTPSLTAHLCTWQALRSPGVMPMLTAFWNMCAVAWGLPYSLRGGIQSPQPSAHSFINLVIHLMGTG